MTSTNTVAVILHNSFRFEQYIKVEIDPANVDIKAIIQKGIKEFQIKDLKYLYTECGQEIIITDLESYQFSNNEHVYVSNNYTFPNAQHQEVRISMIGMNGSGKSALTLRCVLGEFVSEHDPTLEDSYRIETSIDGCPLAVDILDQADYIEDVLHGYGMYNSQTHTRERDGYMFVFDIYNKQSFQHLDKILEWTLKNTYDNVADLPPTILVGNKYDLLSDIGGVKDGLEIYRIVNYWSRDGFVDDEIPNDVIAIIVRYFDFSQVRFEEAIDFANKLGAVRYMEVSAKTGYNVDNAFGSLFRSIMEKKFRVQTGSQRVVKRKNCILL